MVPDKLRKGTIPYKGVSVFSSLELKNLKEKSTYLMEGKNNSGSVTPDHSYFVPAISYNRTNCITRHCKYCLALGDIVSGTSCPHISSSLTLFVHGKSDDLNGGIILQDSNWESRTFRVWSTRAIIRLSFALALYSDVTFSIPDWQLRCL